MAEKTMIKTPFGELPCENNNITMSNSQLMEIYEKKGISNPKEVLDALNTARNEVQHEAAKFLLKKVAETLEPWSLRAGLKENRFEVVAKPETSVTIPGRNGEPSTTQTRYGTIQTKNYTKTPSEIAEDEEMHKLSAEIEKKMKARGDKQIKIA